MDVPRSLIRAAQLLIRQEAGLSILRGSLYRHAAPGQNPRLPYLLVLHADHARGPITAGGPGRTPTEALLRAVAEIGEVMVARDSGAENRSGFAGGLLPSQTLERARAELLERDAFLFHYRSCIPFGGRLPLDEKSADGRELCAFRMSTASDKQHGVIVTDEACAEGRSDCLVFATACSSSIREALAKAVSEYRTLWLAHEMNQPGWCEGIALGRGITSPCDIHHGASRDHRNREIFKFLCISSENELMQRHPADPCRWTVSFKPSPVRFFHYALATHPDLEEMRFGEPEQTKTSYEPPLFHPFW